MDYSKGWFCPLLFASGRTLSIPRADDFTMAEFHGHGLSGKCSANLGEQGSCVADLTCSVADTELTRSLVELLPRTCRSMVCARQTGRAAMRLIDGSYSYWECLLVEPRPGRKHESPGVKAAAAPFPRSSCPYVTRDSQTSHR